jgi:hypothetical protein
MPELNLLVFNYTVSRPEQDMQKAWGGMEHIRGTIASTEVMVRHDETACLLERHCSLEQLSVHRPDVDLARWQPPPLPHLHFFKVQASLVG